jgi:hypothetical protein
MPSNNRLLATQRLVLGLNEGTLGLLGIAILLVGAVVWSARGPNVEKTDFSLTYVGARIVHQGLGVRLYDIAFQKQVRDSIFQRPNPLFYEHPPFEALVLSPLAALPFRTAYMLLGFLNVMAWLLLIFFLRPYLPWPQEDLGYLCLWLLFAPLPVALYQGQSSILLLALYAIAFIKLQQQKEFSAGIWLGLGLLKFQFVLPFAFLFLIRRKWRFLAGFTSSSLFLGLLSLLAVGWKGGFDYVRLLSDISNNPQNLSYGSATDMPTIYGLVHALLGQKIGHSGLNLLVALLSVALLVFVGRRWGSTQERRSNDLVFAAAVPASLLTGSHMFTHDLSPLLLGLFLAAANFPSRSQRGLRLSLAATLVLFWTFPLYFLVVAWHCLYLMCPILLLFTFSALLAATYVGRQTTDAQFVAVG